MQDVSVELQFLAGIRVVDFTQFEAGPSCTEALAWLGAEVVKIENPKTRRSRPPAAARASPTTIPYYFHMFNANKKSITLNLKSPRGLELVKDMLRKADVMRREHGARHDRAARPRLRRGARSSTPASSIARSRASATAARTRTTSPST